MSGSSERPAWSVVLSQKEKDGFAFVHESIDSEQELITLLSAAQQTATAVIRGAPSRLPKNAAVSAAVYADLTPMTAVVEHEVADQVINVQTGITVAELNRYLKQHDQWWPVYAPAGWTVADVLDSGAGGALESRFGGPRELVLGCRVILADGQGINCGGRVVKNVTGYDMGKLFIGSHGWLGIPVSAFLRVYALPPTSQTLVWCFTTGEQAFAAARALNLSGLPLACLEIVSSSALLPAAEFGHLSAAGAVLLTQIYGLPAVVQEIATSATKLVADTMGSGATAVHITDGANETKLWTYVTESFSTVTDHVAVLAASFKTTKALLKDGALLDQEDANIDWIYRPSTGRMALRVGSLADMLCGAAVERASVLQKITNWCAQSQMPVTLAIADTRHNYHVHQLPQQDAALAELQENLKTRLDPSRILNPFVKL